MSAPSSSSIADYGLPVNDYVVDVTDPTTDQPASGANQLGCDVAMMSRPALRAWATFTGSATTPALVSHEAQWGTGTAPTIARTGSGTFTVTWPTSVTDQLGATQSVYLRVSGGEAASSTAYHVQTLVTAANVVTVYTFTAAGVANDLAGVTIKVWAA